MTALARTGPVVFVNNHRETFGPEQSGAIATCVWEVCRAASGTGTRPVVLTRHGAGATYDWAQTSLLPEAGPLPRHADRVLRRATGWRGWAQYTFARDALARLRELQPSVVITNNDPQVAVHLARHLPGVRVLHWFHNVEMAPDRWRRAYWRSSVTSVAVSAFVARTVEALYELKPLEVAVAFNGVDHAVHAVHAGHAGHAGPRGCGAPAEGVPVIGFLGRLAIEKGPDTLLRACLLLAERRRDFAVRLVGDTNWGSSRPGPYRDQIDALARQLQQAGIDVVRTGHLARRDVPAAIARADIFVFPSRWDEPFGLALAEGMALGLPVVATATGGVPEVLAGAGRLVPRDDPTAMATAIEGLLDDPAARAIAGERARRRAEELTWERTWGALMAAV